MTIATKTTIAIGLVVGGMTLGLGGTTKELAAQTADESPGSSAKWDFKSRSPKVAKIENVLQKKADVNFMDIPLKDALDFLEQTHGIQLVVDTKSLSDEGTSIDQNAKLVISGTSLKNVLRLLLAENELDCIIKDDLLMITTVAMAERHFETRVYNTKRLPEISPKKLAEIITGTIEPHQWKPVTQDISAETTSALEPANVEGKNTATVSGGGGGMSFAFGTGQGSATWGAGGGGGGWIHNSGHLGSVRWTQNALVIRQTQRIHEKIVDLLDQLERSEQQSQKVEATESIKR